MKDYENVIVTAQSSPSLVENQSSILRISAPFSDDSLVGTYTLEEIMVDDQNKEEAVLADIAPFDPSKKKKKVVIEDPADDPVDKLAVQTESLAVSEGQDSSFTGLKKKKKKPIETSLLNEDAAVIMVLGALPEGCIAKVIGLMTPRDACRLSLISANFKSAADSDAVWDKFLPPDANEILSKSESKINAKSKKELYFTLSHNPILINDGKLSFSLDKWIGKKCYMISARRLQMAWDDYHHLFWEWISLPNSRFKEAAKLRVFYWIQIQGRIETRMLSPFTTYRAYLVYKLTEYTYGLYLPPAVVTVGARAREFDYECPNLEQIAADMKGKVFLAPLRVIERDLEIGRMMRPNEEIKKAKFPNEGRGDGWWEVELGEYYCQGDEDGELEMICCEITGKGRRGLLVQGIEIRPERD